MKTDDGSASIEFVWLALILLIPMIYVLLTAFEVQRAAFGVSAASRAAARTFVLAPNNSAAHTRAERAAQIALDDHKVKSTTVSITCTPRCHAPGSTVRVLVRAQQPLPLLPPFFGRHLGSIRVESNHTEPFGTFRNRS